MPSSPTPSERERTDAEIRAREKEEQAKLPYKWTQSIKDVDVAVPVPGNLRGKDIEVVMTKTRLKVAVKGQPPVIDVRPYTAASPPQPTVPASFSSGNRLPLSHPLHGAYY